MARLADRLAIEELSAAFAYYLDHGEVAALVGLFAEDAVYGHGLRRSCGRGEIAAFFRERAAAGVRTARHMYSGLRVGFEGEDGAWGSSVWLSFAVNAPPPVAYSVPFLVADFDDVYGRGPDGTWLIRSRQITPIFRDPNGVPLGN